MVGDTKTLLAVKKTLKLFALSGSRDAKTLAMSPHTHALALALAPSEPSGGISTTLFFYIFSECERQSDFVIRRVYIVL